MKKLGVLASVALAAVFCLSGIPAQASPGPQPAPLEFHVPPPRDIPYPGTIQLHVDATDLAHRIYTVHEVIPVSSGPMFLLYPKWIPGYHEPSGPIDQFADLTITADGERIPWIRDPEHVYDFQVDVPQGVHKLDVNFRAIGSCVLV